MIHLHHVVKEYLLGQSVVSALRGISIDIAKGEFVSICGPSGSGKSTLLNMMGALDTPTQGEVMVAGANLKQLSDAEQASLRNRKIGFIFQSFNLIPVLNVFENIDYPLILQGMSSSDRQSKVLALIDQVGLSDFVTHRPDELSGGQRQRVAIARALITQPDIVLADEPTANLDSKTGAGILELMKVMNSRHQTTFVFSTHDDQVKGYATRIINIQDGGVVAEGGMR
ncbi:ABC transporter ATP-binding protein [bacterium]|nr:ABC transporter ATP-binding protein [bacterium]